MSLTQLSSKELERGVPDHKYIDANITLTKDDGPYLWVVRAKGVTITLPDSTGAGADRNMWTILEDVSGAGTVIQFDAADSCDYAGGTTTIGGTLTGATTNKPGSYIRISGPNGGGANFVLKERRGNWTAA